MKLRTSETDPLWIAEIPVGGGVIGVTLCPGKRGASVFGQAWARDLATDVAAITDWGATAVVTLIEEDEFVLLGVEALPQALRAAGIEWHHLPIEDVSVPDQRFERAWPVVWPQLLGRLTGGERVMVHCRGGLGRAGTVAALMLIECGESAEVAIKRVRTARPGAIETAEQERWVRGRQPTPKGST